MGQIPWDSDLITLCCARGDMDLVILHWTSETDLDLRRAGHNYLVTLCWAGWTDLVTVPWDSDLVTLHGESETDLVTLCWAGETDLVTLHWLSKWDRSSYTALSRWDTDIVTLCWGGEKRSIWASRNFCQTKQFLNTRATSWRHMQGSSNWQIWLSLLIWGEK